MTVNQLQDELLKAEEKCMRMEKEGNMRQNEMSEKEFKWINEGLNHKKEVMIYDTMIN